MNLDKVISSAEKRAAEGRELNAFVLELYGRAREEAPRNDPALPLSGTLFSVKDIFELTGTPLKAGTKASLPLVGPQGPVLNAVLAAGATCIGKVNTHEIALGMTGENIWTGDVCNPIDPSRQSGGSSSGSAVSVAIGACDFSFGSDTAGSIRIPASYCGIIGFKPTFGLLSTGGILPLCPSCDHVGVLVRDIYLLKTILDVCIPAGGEKPAGPSAALADSKIGVPGRYLEGRLSAVVKGSFEIFCRTFFPARTEVELPSAEESMTAYTKLRYEARQIHKEAIRKEPENFSPAVRALLESSDVSKAEYLQALAWQSSYGAKLDRVFREIDFLILPTSAVAAPVRGTTEVDLMSGRSSLREANLPLTLPASLAGLPVLSLPLLTARGLPVGLQVVAGRGEDRRLLRFGESLLARVNSHGH